MDASSLHHKLQGKIGLLHVYQCFGGAGPATDAPNGTEAV
jgi:hypothetical protein